VGIEIYEDRTPLRSEVKGFCEILGLDPLYLANEGQDSLRRAAGRC
jgi:hydrogenase expression/formation protein HypE